MITGKIGANFPDSFAKLRPFLWYNHPDLADGEVVRLNQPTFQ